MNIIIFSQYLISKLCHDLISPIGTIINSLDLLSEVEIAREDQQTLYNIAKRCASEATAKLIYYRTALGYRGIKKLLDDGELVSFIEKYLHSVNIKFIPRLENEYLSQDIIRIILNIVLLVTDYAYKDTQLKVVTDSHNDLFTISLTGVLSIMHLNQQAALQGNIAEDDCDSHNIQAILIHMFIKSSDFKLVEIKTTRELLEIQISTKA